MGILVVDPLTSEKEGRKGAQAQPPREACCVDGTGPENCVAATHVLLEVEAPVCYRNEGQLLA